MLREKIWDIFYPRRCALCDQVLKQREQKICSRCAPFVRVIREPFCLKCGRPLEGEEELCEQCKRRSYSFAFGRAAFVYDRYMRRSMKYFKYYGRQEYASFYAEILYQQYRSEIENAGADALVPVPIHKARFLSRGYNQAAVLARELSVRSGIPAYEDFLVRTKKTVPQKELSSEERLKNLCHAFSVNRSFLELSKWINCVIIIDDIYTTGSTIEACSRALGSFGIKKVIFLCACTGQGD